MTIWSQKIAIMWTMQNEQLVVGHVRWICWNPSQKHGHGKHEILHEIASLNCICYIADSVLYSGCCFLDSFIYNDICLHKCWCLSLQKCERSKSYEQVRFSCIFYPEIIIQSNLTWFNYPYSHRTFLFHFCRNKHLCSIFAETSVLTKCK